MDIKAIKAKLARVSDKRSAQAFLRQLGYARGRLQLTRMGDSYTRPARTSRDLQITLAKHGGEFIITAPANSRYTVISATLTHERAQRFVDDAAAIGLLDEEQEIVISQLACIVVALYEHEREVCEAAGVTPAAIAHPEQPIEA